MTVSNTPNDLPSALASLPAELAGSEEASSPSALSLVLLQMKEKLKNIPKLPMAVTMVGAGLLGFAFISGVPFSFPLLVSGAIVLGLGVAWLMSSQIAKGLGIGSHQEDEDDSHWQASAPAVLNEERAVTERRVSETPSQPSQTDSQEREERHSRQAQADEVERRSANKAELRRESLKQNDQRQENKRRGDDKAQSARLRFGSHQAKLKAFETKPKAKKEEELPKAGRDNLAFDDYYDDDLDDFYSE